MKEPIGTTEKPTAALPPPKKKRTLRDVFDVDYLRGVAVGAVAAVLVLGLVYYVLYHVSGGFRPAVAVTPALTATARTTETHTAWYFRDETLLYAAYAGAVDAAVADGERVGAGQYLLTAYENPENAAVTEKLRVCDAAIALLTDSAPGGNVTLSDTRALEDRLTAGWKTVRADLAAGEYDKVSSAADGLLVLLNRRALIFSSQSGYTERLASLRAERDGLAAELTGNAKKVYAPQTAYFYRDFDGAEELFGTEQLAALTPSALDALAERCAAVAKPVNAVGKLAPSRKWYLALEVDAASLAAYTVGALQEVIFPENGGMTLAMKLEYTAVEGARGLLVLSSERQTDGVARCSRVRLVTHTYTGLRVPMSAIRHLDGCTGVYARFGNTILFRVCDLLGTVNGYGYVDPATAPVYETVTAADGTVLEGALRYGALALYDEVVCDGTGMYHGLIVD